MNANESEVTAEKEEIKEYGLMQNDGKIFTTCEEKKRRHERWRKTRPGFWNWRT